MPVRTRKRQGRKTWVIDIRYEYNGKRERFRRDAQVQTALAARAEDRRRIGMLATTGLPFDRREVTGDPVLATGSAASEPSVKVEAPRFEDVVRDYLQQFAPSHLKPSTRAGYTDVINAHLLPTLRGLRLDEIDAKVVRAMDAGLAAKGRRPSTRRNVQAVLRSIVCRYAEEAGLLGARPNLPRLPKVGATVSSTLSVGEIRQLLGATDGDERLALMLAAFSGLRAGEVRGLRWRDVNLAKGLLVVRRNICNGEASAPKSGHERLVPLVPELREALGRARTADLDAAVTSGRRKPWTDGSLTNAFRRARDRAGLRGWRLHDLRHFYVTSLFRAGLPAPLVQRLAGHEHLVTTQRYAHLVELDLAGVSGALDRVVRGNSGETES
jgi:integrase